MVNFIVLNTTEYHLRFSAKVKDFSGKVILANCLTAYLCKNQLLNILSLLLSPHPQAWASTLRDNNFNDIHVNVHFPRVPSKPERFQKPYRFATAMQKPKTKDKPPPQRK
jgi:hypothetical protein